MGFCPGIENYSRHLDGREPGEPPYTLLDYFPKDFLLVVDESHVTVPQIGGMYRGDRSRKETLVEFGFRLPSALDNRPLNFEEFLARMPQALYVSATPGDWEVRMAKGQVVEQLIRPTGLMDPEVIVRPARHQVDDLVEEIRVARGGARTRAGDDAHEEDGRGPHRLPAGHRHPGALHPRRHRHDRAQRDHPRAAQGNVRRPGRHQPAARGARPARGVAGRDPRRRQGGLPALRALAHPDHRPGGAERARDACSCTPTR